MLLRRPPRPHRRGTARVMSAEKFRVRPFVDSDEAAVRGLLSQTLGWRDDEYHRDLFRWKHYDNPFGRSYGLVAEAGGEVVGVRLFLRWEFRLDGEVVRAVRAVDTATHPAHQGRGIFRSLTQAALEELQHDGVGFVFNTPNEQSRPGYLKLGWRVIGQLPARVRPADVRAVGRLLRARAPADLHSLPTSSGRPVEAAQTVVGSPVGDKPADGTVTTNRSSAYLAWRYGNPLQAYRVWQESTDSQGLVFRLRARGPSTEVVAADPPAAAGAAVPGVGGLLRETGASHVLGLGAGPRVRCSLPLPRAGPLLVARPLARMPPLDVTEWQLTMGDVELF